MISATTNGAVVPGLPFVLIDVEVLASANPEAWDAEAVWSIGDAESIVQHELQHFEDLLLNPFSFSLLRLEARRSFATLREANARLPPPDNVWADSTDAATMTELKRELAKQLRPGDGDASTSLVGCLEASATLSSWLKSQQSGSAIAFSDVLEELGPLPGTARIFEAACQSQGDELTVLHLFDVLGSAIASTEHPSDSLPRLLANHPISGLSAERRKMVLANADESESRLHRQFPDLAWSPPHIPALDQHHVQERSLYLLRERARASRSAAKRHAMGWRHGPLPVPVLFYANPETWSNHLVPFQRTSVLEECFGQLSIIAWGKDQMRRAAPAIGILPGGSYLTDGAAFSSLMTLTMTDDPTLESIPDSIGRAMRSELAQLSDDVLRR